MMIIDETDERFYIAESGIPNTGLGLFAKQEIKEGDSLEVIGALVRVGSTAARCTTYANSYKFAAAEPGKCTCHVVPFGYAGMVNHTDDPTKQNVGLRYYKSRQKRSEHAGQVVYEALRDIHKDEEILGNYGEKWGEVFEWMRDTTETIDKNEEAWKTFLSYDLYNLGSLNELR